MRSIKLGLGISIDGYIARPDGAYDFLFMPKDYSMTPFLKSVDTAIMGRKTYDVSLQSGATYDPRMRSYVVSRSLPPGARDGVTFTNTPVAKLVEDIRERRGKDVWLMGGGEIVREFLAADLVDEMEIGIVPVLLGQGIPLFPAGFPQRDFALVECQSYSQGLVVLKYKRARAKGKPKRRRDA